MLDLPDILQQDEFGGIRLAGHRIAFSHFLWHYKQGYTAEMLLGQFPTLPLAIIHKTIGYYLDHEEEVDAYLTKIQQQLEEQRLQGNKLNIDQLRARMPAKSQSQPLKAG